MKEVRIVVTNSTAKALRQLLDKGITPSFKAFNLALCSRPMKGERWIRIGEVEGGVSEGWERLPTLLRCGTRH
jgi:hypothetical protein